MAIRRLTATFEKKIALRLRDCRESRGLTQQQLAEMVDCTTGYISEIERLKKRPSLEFIYRFASALGTTASDVLRGTDGRTERELLKRNIIDSLNRLESQVEEYLDS